MITHTSGPYNGDIFSTPDSIVNSVHLAQVTRAELAGKTLASYAPACTINENVLTCTAAGPSRVTLSQYCGGLPPTVTASAVPALKEGTGTSGYFIYGWLAGLGFIPGAHFALIQEVTGSLSSNGNGNLYQGDVGAPILSVN